MMLVHRNPLRVSDAERLFDGFFGSGQLAEAPRRFAPAIDVVEHENELLLTADLPGMTEDDVTIEVDDGVLSVSGERQSRREETEKGYRRLERSFGRFSRALRLPRGTDADAITARFEHGVLEVRIPKPEARKPRRIEIGRGEAGAEREAIEAEATETS